MSTEKKPTTTDTTINFHSNHPIEHKLSAYRYLINSMTSLPLTKANQSTEWTNILATAHNNNFPIHLINKLITKMTNTLNNNTPKQLLDHQWTTFTYFSPKIRIVTNIFKDSKLNIAFRSNNTLATILNTKHNHIIPHQDNLTQFNKSGISKLSCMTSNKVYIAQTNRNIAIR